MEEFKHYTVMRNEAVDALNCESGKIYVDCTLGSGGHSELILSRIQPDGKLISFDVDEDAIKAASKRLEHYENLIIVKDSYTNIKKVLQRLGIEKISGGVLLDLGASYHQLTKQERGFSFSKDAKLDMRFNQDAGFSAYDVVNSYSEKELVRIFSEYGEERFSKRIAKKIVEKRSEKPIETTLQLAELVLGAVPKIKHKIHPATRVFQAIRIEVNQELNNVKKVLEDIIPLMSIGAIISVISFHSLEDRLVKNFFKQKAARCNCPPNKAICDCPPSSLKIVTKKPVCADEKEIRENPPSRSAKLRVAQRI